MEFDGNPIPLVYTRNRMQTPKIKFRDYSCLISLLGKPRISAILYVFVYMKVYGLLMFLYSVPNIVEALY
jgi:hypothetical protein